MKFRIRWEEDEEEEEEENERKPSKIFYLRNSSGAFFASVNSRNSGNSRGVFLQPRRLRAPSLDEWSTSEDDDEGEEVAYEEEEEGFEYDQLFQDLNFARLHMNQHLQKKSTTTQDTKGILNLSVYLSVFLSFY